MDQVELLRDVVIPISSPQAGYGLGGSSFVLKAGGRGALDKVALVATFEITPTFHYHLKLTTLTSKQFVRVIDGSSSPA